MFYTFAIISMLAYGLQHALLVHHARRMDGLSLAFYRGISFSITLLPLLIGASPADITGVLGHWRILLLSGMSGGLYLALNFEAYRFAPVGLVQTITRAASTIAMTFIGWMFFDDLLTPTRLLLIGLVVAGCLWLGLQKSAHGHLVGTVTSGIALAIACSLPLSVTHAAIAFLSRTERPLVSGYFWELSIALACALLLVMRSVFLRKHITHLRPAAFVTIAACALPTLIGTGFYSLALNMGPLSIVSAIGGGSLVIMTLLAWWWYGERLRAMQWTAILTVFAAIVGLKFV